MGALAPSMSATTLPTYLKLAHQRVKQAGLRKVWRMSEKLVFSPSLFSTATVEIGGGKGSDTEAEWQRLLDLCLNLKLVFEV